MEENTYIQKARKRAGNSPFVIICARLEEELTALNSKEQLEYLESFGLHERTIDRLIRTAFDTLGLITFYTAGEKEVRAWTVQKGATAPEAAGKIHTDLQKGFIRAEVISYKDFCLYKGRSGAKDAGKARIEGKNYIVQDDDVILFYHN